jgi:hypothetical protein
MPQRDPGGSPPPVTRRARAVASWRRWRTPPPPHPAPPAERTRASRGAARDRRSLAGSATDTGSRPSAGERWYPSTCAPAPACSSPSPSAPRSAPSSARTRARGRAQWCEPRSPRSGGGARLRTRRRSWGSASCRRAGGRRAVLDRSKERLTGRSPAPSARRKLSCSPERDARDARGRSRCRRLRMPQIAIARWLG